MLNWSEEEHVNLDIGVTPALSVKQFVSIEHTIELKIYLTVNILRIFKLFKMVC